MTLHYPFPYIKNISDVLPHIEGDDAFVVVEKDYGITVVNYVWVGKDTFPSVFNYDRNEDQGKVYSHSAAIRRECRGLIFETASGALLSRRLTKFFNLGERDDMIPDFSEPHQVLEKLDGSMISPIKIGDGIRWATKMGITTVSMQAEVFVASRPEYQRLAEWCINNGCTPIFEWCSRKQRIVLDYPQDDLVLLAVRENRWGTYYGRHQVTNLALQHSVSVVKAIDASTTDMDSFVSTIRSWEDAEGVVIAFDDGSMVKVKADLYVSLHRAKSLIENERDTVGLILDDKLDDLLPVLPPHDRGRLETFAAEVWGDIHRFQHEVVKVISLAICYGMTRKDFALSGVTPNPQVRAACFNVWDQLPDSTISTSARDYAIGFIRKHLGSKKSFEMARNILTTARYNEVQEA